MSKQEDYMPFGEEWRKEMKKLSKDQIIDMLKKVVTEKAEIELHVQTFMDDIHQWADNTFGADRKTIAVLHHLKQEVPELIEAIEKYGDKMKPLGEPKVEFEFADCFILILNAASKYGLNFNQLMYVSMLKLEICKNREWGKPDANGVVNHIKKEIVSDEKGVRFKN